VAVTSQWQSASDEDWALALARAAVIRPLTDQAELTEGLVATASAELGISRSLVYRFAAKFRKRPQVSSLLPGKRGRKAAARALSEATEAVVRKAIASAYLQREVLKEVAIRPGQGRSAVELIDGVAMPKNGSSMGHDGKELAQELVQKDHSLSSAQEPPLEKEIQAVRQCQKTVQEYITRQPYHHPSRQSTIGHGNRGSAEVSDQNESVRSG
jgi:hypothetical protein